MTPDDLRALCARWGPRVVGAASFDKPSLMFAVGSVESSAGANNVPRHEDSWCPNMVGLLVCRMERGGYRILVRGGAGVNLEVWRRFRVWGCSACCSWSPWQIHYQTAADMGFGGAPWALSDPAVAVAFVAQRLSHVLGGPDPSESVEEVADAWNSGNYVDPIRPAEYMARVRAAYDVEVAR